MDHNHPQSFVGFDHTIQGILDYLEHLLPGYPFLTATDTLFVEELQRDFPHLDILKEIKTFRWYFDDDLSSKKKNTPRFAQAMDRSFRGLATIGAVKHFTGGLTLPLLFLPRVPRLHHLLPLLPISLKRLQLLVLKRHTHQAKRPRHRQLQLPC